MSELQPAFAGAVGHRLHAAVVFVPTPVEHDAGDTLLLRHYRDLLPHAEVPPPPLRLARRHRCRAHYFPPALPAFRRICSPAYLMPLPLYGSGGRRLRSSAATWPTSSLFAPSPATVVGFGALSLIPCGARNCT